MSEIKPIETEYNGLRFRSRLEARWAVFFDEAGIKYIYEPEGYVTSSGVRYLPDFYLPEERAFVEVKGSQEQYAQDLERLNDIIMAEGSPVNRLVILGEVPYSAEANGVYWFPVLYKHPLYESIRRSYVTILWLEEDEQAHFEFDSYRLEHGWEVESNLFPGIDAPEGMTGMCSMVYEIHDYRESSFYPGAKRITWSPNPVPDEIANPIGQWNLRSFNDDEDLMTRLVSAYKRARQARFEHGENP